MTNLPLFGANVDPTTNALQETFARAQLADQLGLDLVMMQDHPYNRRFMETWTLLTAIAMRTERVHLGTNVANLPLRPPAMLAKAAATLDVISGGRVELGLGAGAFWQGVTAFGEPARAPKEAYAAFEDALHIIKGLWEHAGRAFTYQGAFYRVQGAQFGPAPVHPIRLWVGASGPKMLRLTGKMADGVLVSSTYEPPQRLLEINRQINDGAAEAGRSPDDIRRGYNLMGIVDVGQVGGKPSGLQQGVIYGKVKAWVDELVRCFTDYGQDAFIFWPVGEQPVAQLEAFAKDIAPAVREAISRG
jgi:alkanesulfonate monooxygenase SsuD/methylene tetrahydromethanopterin reductase-like flavin-dependent oxidoreductase (luciferase family)